MSAARLLDELLPTYDFNEVHSIDVKATPEEAIAALKRLPGKDVRLLAPLMTLRSLPPRLLHRGEEAAPVHWDGPLWDQMLKEGFTDLGATDTDLAFGTVGQPYRLDWGGEKVTISGPADFIAFDRPGFCKVAADFVAVPIGKNLTHLRTETRVLATDPATKRKFAAYWVLIRLGSGAIRRSWLHAVRRELGA